MDTQLKDHLDYPDDITSILRRRTYNKLLFYTNFSLCELILMTYPELSGLLIDNNTVIIKHLVNNIICIDVKDRYGLSFVHCLFIYSKNVKLIHYFVNKYRFDLNAKVFFSGTMPIHFACQYGSLEIVKYLVDKDIDLESKGINGQKPLHYAFKSKLPNTEIIDFLVNKGANLESEDVQGHKPIHYAYLYGSLDIKLYIINKYQSLGLKINDNNANDKLETIKNELLDTQKN